MKNIARIVFYFFIFLFQGNTTHAQDPYIFNHDRYSGISTVGISPTQSYFNPNRWDFHLFSNGIFVQNRYGYISKSSLFGLTKGEIRESDIEQNITGENTKKVWDYFNFDETGYHFSNELMGPSFSYNFEIGDRFFTAGFFTKLRTQSSIIEVDNYLQFTNQEIDEPILYNLDPFKANFMNWTELGFNFATRIFPYAPQQWIIGANFKYLMGNDAFYVNNRQPALLRREQHEILDPTNPGQTRKVLFASDFDVEVGYATGYNFEKEAYEYQTMGTGFGADVGISMVNYNGNDEDYDFKLSANILDIGSVKFDGFVHEFIGNNFQYTHNPALEDIDFESVEQYAQIISQEIYGDENRSLISNDFTIGLPTSLHVNASKNIAENTYINADIIQRTPVFQNSLKRSNILHLSYLFNTHKWAYGGALSLVEYKYLRAGAFLRYGPLVIGSENFLPIFIPHQKLKGADFYIGLKIYPFRNRDMERRSRKPCKC
ncbi:hypothetical protein [Moheibacter stercoris]|uniref:DUF5723 domain-containing protein n=1 Tax=Moheibacter stercoris TaxID=1628251 RepID=A0ABV2LUS1_9FLAO